MLRLIQSSRIADSRCLQALSCGYILLMLGIVAPLVQATPRTFSDDRPSHQAPLIENIVWSEDWESNPDNRWFANAGTWEMGDPSSGPGEAFDGTNVAATVLDGNYGGSVDSRLIRIASFTIPEASAHPRLRFWHWYQFGGGTGDAGEVQISTDGGTTWQSISPAYSGHSSSVWTRPSLDLRPFAGETVQLAFWMQSGPAGPGPGWYIDEVALVTGVPTLINPELFEAGLGDWAVDYGTWQVGTPSAGPSACYEGSNCAATVLAGNYAGNQNTRLITPPFIVPPVSESPNLRFWHWYQFGGGTGDLGEVQITTDEGETWETISGPYTGSSSGAWTRPFVDLSAYAGNVVQIAFRMAAGPAGPGPGWYVDNFTVVCNGAPCSDLPLPVELTAFDAVANGTDVRLDWQTASETSNAGFEVQHRSRNAPFKTLHFIKGAGTTTESQHYTYRINGLAHGSHAFRLKQIDLDGAFAYSPVIEVVIGIPAAHQLTSVFPNPFHQRAQLSLTVAQPQHVQVALYNMLGQRVDVLLDDRLSANTPHPITLAGEALPSGLYLVHITGETFSATRKAVLAR